MNTLLMLEFLKTQLRALAFRVRAFFAAKPPRLSEEIASKILAKVQTDNLVKSLDDERDYIFVPTVDPTDIIKSNNRPFSPAIEDQLSLGSCTGNSVSTACESVENTVRPYQRGTTDLSRLFAYQMAQKVDNLTGDVGATIKGSFLGVRRYGIPREHEYPYDISKYGTDPSPAIMELALQRRINRFEKIEIDKSTWPYPAHRTLQAALAEGLRVVMGFHVERWMLYITGPMETHGSQPGPLNKGDPMLDRIGGHAVFIEDFDKSLNPSVGGSYIIHNSWGTQWGDNGRWAMPMTRLFDFAFDLYAVRSFADATVGGPYVAPPLTAAQLAEGRNWLVDHGIGTYDANGNYIYTFDAPVGNFVAAGAAKRAGYTPEQYATIIGLPGADVKAFMEAPGNQNMINAYAR